MAGAPPLRLRLGAEPRPRLRPAAEGKPTGQNGPMPDLPRKAVTRTAKLASLPLGYAGRTAVGMGKRLGGAPAEAVMVEVQQRTAEQLFRPSASSRAGR